MRTGILVFAVIAVLIPLSAAYAGPIDVINNSPSLGDMIANLYDYSLTVAVLGVFVMLLYAGLQLMITGDKDKAVKIVQDAVIGTILLYSAVIILNAINPDYTHQQQQTSTTK